MFIHVPLTPTARSSSEVALPLPPGLGDLDPGHGVSGELVGAEGTARVVPPAPPGLPAGHMPGVALGAEWGCGNAGVCSLFSGSASTHGCGSKPLLNGTKD